MLQQSCWASIDLHQIHDSGEWNLHPFLTEPANSPLTHSLLQSGMLHPPVVRDNQDGYDLLCGRRRLSYLKQTLGQTSCLCRVLPSDTPALTLLHVILADQETAGPLSPMEQAWFLSCCGRHLDQAGVIKTFLPRLGCKAHVGQLENLLRLLDLNPLIQGHIHAGQIDETVALDLLRLDPDDQRFMTELFAKLGMGRGKQKRLLSLCQDLAGRTDCQIRELFADEEGRMILESMEMNPPQTAGRLLELLQKRCRPRSTAAEMAFKKELSGLKLPSHWRIEHSPAFEKDEVTLSIPFADLASCTAQLAALTQLLK